MKSWKLSLLALSLAAGSAFAGQQHNGEVIVKFKDSAQRGRAVMNSLYQSTGAVHVLRLKGMMKGYEVLSLDSNVKMEDAIAELSKSPAVEFAQPNYILRIEPVLSQKAAPNAHTTGIPCIPGLDIPNCDPKACLFPGFPAGCDESGGGDPGENPGNPGNPGNGGGSQPAVNDAPSEVNPPVADPNVSNTYGMTKVGAVDAWKTHRGDKKFVVAVIDTGIDYNHEDLAFNLWRNKKGQKGDVVGYNFIHNNEYPFDDQKHGTHTAGTVGATGGNGKGVSGVIQNVSIMGVKFLSAKGEGSTSGAIQSIDFAVANGARVLSNSWGGPGDQDNKALYDAVERAKAKNVLFVAAAGNDGKNNDTDSGRSYPAAFDNDNLISVAATDSNDRLASFSNYGVKTTALAAPGVKIFSTIAGGGYSDMYAPGQPWSGTSMACPHVAGAAALIWSKNPTMNYKQVKEILLKSVDVIPGLQGKVATGGRLNVLKALTLSMKRK